MGRENACRKNPIRFGPVRFENRLQAVFRLLENPRGRTQKTERTGNSLARDSPLEYRARSVFIRSSPQIFGAKERLLTVYFENSQTEK